MTPAAIIAVALVAAVIVGTIAVWGAPFLAIPVVIVAAGVGFLLITRRRVQANQSIGEFRDQARPRQERVEEMSADDGREARV